jgi:folate-binding protein YgfZ
MTRLNVALLADRGVVAVTGDDATKLLQGIITNDMDLLAAQPAIHSALLTPQGKILFEFIVARAPDGYLVDIARGQIGDFIKRLTLYKLRAKVDIRDAGADRRVIALWGDSAQNHGEIPGSISFVDPRLPALGKRIIAEAALADEAMSATSGAGASLADYDAHRITLGIPELGKDYASATTFAHEANLDSLKSVSFSKGCFIGQEVASRMEHRGTARTRTVIVEADAPLAPSGAITAGEAQIGTVGSTAGTRALALVRLDRAEEASQKGQQIAAGSVPVDIRRPGYLKPATATATS